MTRVVEVVRRGRQGAQGNPGADGAAASVPSFGGLHDLMFLRREALNTPISKNTNYTGTFLRYAGISDGTQGSTTQADNTAPPGTWRAHGSVRASSTDYAMTLFRRIA